MAMCKIGGGSKIAQPTTMQKRPLGQGGGVSRTRLENTRALTIGTLNKGGAKQELRKKINKS